MPTYNIRGINVDFPFEAYDCQLVYMEKVIQSLQNKTNALLESPTGTGKTLCLLCATLAWRRSLGAFSTGKGERRGLDGGGKGSDQQSSQDGSPKLPTIVYTSRTHSQLRQVVQELKRTNYRPKMIVLGSREQLCIHEEVRLLRGRAQTNACHALCRKRNKRYCSHYPRVTEFIKNNLDLGDEPIDIEDLVNIGRSCGPCPYYVSRELHKAVDILFAPYNYLIDRGYRESLSLDWANSILIFDEAHNLESLCADAASFDLPSSLLTACVAEAKNCIDLSIGRREKSQDKSCNPDNFAILKALLLKLEKRIAEVPIESKELGFTKPGPYIYELLADLNITDNTASMLNGIIEEAIVLLEEDANGADSGVQQKAKGTVCRLESIGDILKIIFRDKGNTHAKYYRVHVQEVETGAADLFKGKASRTLSWWCFSPGIAMEEFSRLAVGSIILTSGTLSPMDSFAEELKLEFPVRLENPHVISSNQLWAGVAPVGPSGFSFNSSYRSRDSIEYKQELGNAIVNFARIVPDGLLVFFPSYYLLDQCIGCWKNMGNGITDNASSIWERICKYKLPVIEPRQSSLFPLAIDDYMTKLKDTSSCGAVFFAVCRGKVSEGLDFADHAGRAVVITGMPFAPRTDPKVRLKREFLDSQAQSQRTGFKALTGEEWYNQQAARAVNQAVGRVIRHRHDYGAIIFCDERFLQSNRQSQISLWIRPHIKCYSKFGDVVFTLTRFFRDERICGPTKPELTLTENQGNTMDKLFLEKFLAPQNMEADSTHSFETVTSKVKVTQANIPCQLREIPPANRTSLTSSKQNQNFTLKHASYMLCDGKKPSIPERKVISQKIVDLTQSASLDNETRKEMIAACSLKKRKLLGIKPCQKQLLEESSEHAFAVRKAHTNNHLFISNLEEKVTSLISENGTLPTAQDGSVVLLEDGMTVHGRTTESINQKNKIALSSPSTSGDEERRGAAFLIQVQEKLTDAEYKEFVGFMKALKSKAMRIDHVLQSIVRLFSAPDRLHLLQRFNSYVPSKYQSLYEQFLKTNDTAVGL